VKDLLPHSSEAPHVTHGITSIPLLLAVAMCLLGFSSYQSMHSELAITFLDRNGEVIGQRGARVDTQQALQESNYFLDWAASEVRRLMKGKHETVLVAQTTLDAALQANAEAAVTKAFTEYGSQYRVNQAALVSLEVPDGAVRAFVGGRDFRVSQKNYATEARRQTGSSFMPYVYLTALDGGATPDQVVADSAVTCGNWTPRHNDGVDRGHVTLRQALAQSINTVAVKLSLENAYGGREKVLANLEKAGIGGLKRTCSLALGDQGISLLSHTAGYLHFANGGKSAKPYAIVELRDAQGKVIYGRSQEEKLQRQLFDGGAVDKLNRMLRGAVIEGTGKNAVLDGIPMAGKTGTSSAYRDAWFMGFTGLYVTGVWFGNDDLSATNRMTGGTLPARVWQTFNSSAHQGKAIPPIPGLELPTSAVH
jgi:penicillin-binding protein 1A